MIISSYYNGETGKTVTLEACLNDNYFPEKYTVTDEKHKKTQFPGTKKGAADARRYYENIISIYKYE